jgi:hypothetical protein
MNPSNPLQSEEPGIGNDSFYAASAVSPNAYHQDKHLLCLPLTALPNHYLMLHRHWRIHILRNQRANNHFLIVLHRFGTNIYGIMLGNWKDSNEAHYSAVMAAIQYSEINHETDEFFPDSEDKDYDNFSLHQNPTKTPIIAKNFLRALPYCPIIHWVSQMCNYPWLCFCPCSKNSSPWRDNKNNFIHHDHGCMVGLMTPQELLQHLRSEGDATHTAISI